VTVAALLRCLFGFYATLIPIEIIAQEKINCQREVANPFEMISGQPCEGNYLYPVHQITANRDYLLGEIPENLYYQSLAVAYCNLGAYHKALVTWDLQVKRSHKEEESHDFSDYKAVNAKGELAALIDGHQFVMINEAHHVALHRFFIRQLLQDFYDNGFTYMAVEALSQNGVGDLVIRGYPIQSSGTYSIEPQFGQLIRSAIGIGFKLIAYDVSESNMNLRDSLQAENILNHIQDEKDAKVLVYAGFGHIREKTSNGWITLAQAIQRQTGTDLLTVDQVQLTEKSSVDYQPDFYNTINQLYNFSEPCILKNSESQYWNLPDDEGVYDIQIIHPVSTLEFGRPHWLSRDSHLHKRKIEVFEAVEELLVQAYSVKESESFEIKDLIPFDQTVIEKRENGCFLFLPKGEYSILISDKNGVLESRRLMVD